MKTFAWILLCVIVLFTILVIGSAVIASWSYENTISAPWALADKASTIPQKAKYIDQFVANLKASGLQGRYNAVWLKTPNNSFDANLEQLETLQVRLREIQNMDVASFQYQTAIQQITAQEQGEAKNMLSIFKGVWYKANYWYLWNWILAVLVILLVVAGIADLIVFAKAYKWNMATRRN
jgi:flagellar basal body-associated protein FliL